MSEERSNEEIAHQVAGEPTFAQLKQAIKKALDALEKRKDEEWKSLITRAVEAGRPLKTKIHNGLVENIKILEAELEKIKAERDSLRGKLASLRQFCSPDLQGFIDDALRVVEPGESKKIEMCGTNFSDYTKPHFFKERGSK